mgnify:CR=1 FL=1
MARLFCTRGVPSASRLVDAFQRLGAPDMPLTTIHKDTNPNLSTDGRHVATMRLCFVAGLLHQLWNPCDWSTDEPE